MSAAVQASEPSPMSLKRCFAPVVDAHTRVLIVAEPFAPTVPSTH